jgi:hypothetical protein
MYALQITFRLILFLNLQFFPIILLILTRKYSNNFNLQGFIMTQLLRTTIVTPTLLLFSLMTLWLPVANAAVLGTGSAETNPVVAPTDDDAIQTFLSKETVQQQLVQLGVSPELAMARVAALTPTERQFLEENITDLPTGAGAVEVIGIVFIVLLILELIGVIDIFKKI